MVDCQREQVRNENRKILSQRRDFDKSTVVFVKVDGDGFMTLPMMFDVFFDYSSPAIMSFKIEIRFEQIADSRWLGAAVRRQFFRFF